MIRIRVNETNDLYIQCRKWEMVYLLIKIIEIEEDPGQRKIMSALYSQVNAVVKRGADDNYKTILGKIDRLSQMLENNGMRLIENEQNPKNCSLKDALAITKSIKKRRRVLNFIKLLKERNTMLRTHFKKLDIFELAK